MLRSVAAVAAGFVFMWTTGRVATIVVGGLFWPGLVIRVFGAVLGGWLAARFAPRAPIVHACALAVLVTAMAVASVRAAPAASAPPLTGSVIATVLAVGGILAGGWLRASAELPPS